MWEIRIAKSKIKNKAKRVVRRAADDAVDVITAPLGVGAVVRGPRMAQPRSQMSSFTRSEYVGEVDSSSEDFSVRTFRINAANGSLFKWLSSFARKYDQYEIQDLTLKYVPRCSTTTAGSVLFAVDVNPDDKAPDCKSDMMAMRHSVSSNPWVPMQYSVPKSVLRSKGVLFSSSHPPDDQSMAKDFGNFYIATQGFTGSAGEFHVSYRITLRNPQSAAAVVYARGWFNADQNSIEAWNESTADGVALKVVSGVEESEPDRGMLKISVPENPVTLVIYNVGNIVFWNGSDTPFFQFYDVEGNEISVSPAKFFSSDGTAVGGDYCILATFHIDKDVITATSGVLHLAVGGLASNRNLNLLLSDEI